MIIIIIPRSLREEIKEKEKRDKYKDLAKELKTAVEHKRNSDTNSNWCTWNGPERFGKGAGSVENRKTSRDHPNYDRVNTGQNTEKSPGDLRRLAATKTVYERLSACAGVEKLTRNMIIVPIEYKERRDKIGHYIHWKICQYWNLDAVWRKAKESLGNP